MKMIAKGPEQGAKTKITETIYYDQFEHDLGLIVVASSAVGLCAILMGSTSDTLLDILKKQFKQAQCTQDTKRMANCLKQVREFLDGGQIEPTIMLDIRGTDFQKRVWHSMTEIPRGTTLSYQQLANEIGATQSVRAVANACGANNLAPLIPCHRVIKKDGSLSGYRWGVELKRKLLERESYQ